MNFNNEVTEIPFVQFLLPNVHEVPKGEVLRKKPIVATKLLKFKGVRREKKIVATKLPKFKGERKKKGMKKKKLWQAEYERKKQKQKEWYFFFFLEMDTC